MKRNNFKMRALLGLTLGLALLGIACGGGGGGSTTPPVTVSITISPPSVSVPVSATQQFTATVTGTSNTAVTWSVNSVVGGNSTVGTITTSGLYTAPAVVPSSSTVTITATSQADTSKSASATVTIVATISVSISPTSATVATLAVQQFAATVTGTSNKAVTWSVNTVGGGNSTVGTITTSGLYTAPAVVPSPSTVTITATSQADTSKSASATVTIVASSGGVHPVTVTANVETPNVNVDVSPLTPTLSMVAVGTCPTTTCTAGSVGITMKQGQQATIFLVGNGIVLGTTYGFGGAASDLTFSQASISFCTTNPPNPLPCVTFDVAVASSAALGPRNIMVNNPAGELAVFVGGLLITQGP